MCGRFTLKTQPDQWGQLLLPLIDFSVINQTEWTPRYNIAPTQNIVAIAIDCDRGERFTGRFRWGLVPPWADDLSIGNRMINARGETILEKRSFSGCMARRRCVILADGYYEWKVEGKSKQPYWIHRPDESVFALAGLWETNVKATSSAVQSCTIITTSANERLAHLHDRMPIVLDAPSLDAWLAPQTTAAVAATLLKPAEDSVLTFRQVSTRVNNPRTDDPSCLEPV